MKTRLPIWLFPMLMLVMVALVAVMPKSQDTRRGAYFSGGTKLMLQPAEGIGVTVGNEFPVQLWVETQNITGTTIPAKVDFVKTLLCYEASKIQIEGDTLGAGVTAVDLTASLVDLGKLSVGTSFAEVVSAVVTNEGGNTKCLDLRVGAGSRAKERLGSGLVQVAMLKFKALTAGDGTILINKEMSAVSGYNPGDVPGLTGIDMAMEIGTVTGATYTVTQAAAGGQKWGHVTNQSACNTTTGNWTCSQSNDGTFDTRAACEADAGCDVTGVVANAVDWKTDWVRLRADDFYMDIGRTRYLAPLQGSAFGVRSDPADPPLYDYTTLELRWSEHGREMALNFYLRANREHWWLDELRTYNGAISPKWLSYPSLDSGDNVFRYIGSPFIGDFDRSAISADGMIKGRVYFKNMRLETGVGRAQPGLAWPVLNYRVAFAGVRPTAETACANWKLSIVVKKGDLTKTYESTPVADGAVPDGVVGQHRAYKGSVVLTDFGETSGVAVFIKGPKHLQMKYGRAGQTGFYNRAGGEITLTREVATSLLYDWTGYPIVPCDVVGDSATTPANGVCNAVDYSVVKKASVERKKGENMVEDLDGSCDTNANDLNLLMQAYTERQEQLY